MALLCMARPRRFGSPRRRVGGGPNPGFGWQDPTPPISILCRHIRTFGTVEFATRLATRRGVLFPKDPDSMDPLADLPLPLCASDRGGGSAPGAAAQRGRLACFLCFFCA